MELRVERDALADAVVWTARSLPARPPMQVLLGLLLETSEQGLSVSGFDYEVSSQIRVDVTTAEPGRVLGRSPSRARGAKPHKNQLGGAMGDSGERSVPRRGNRR